ncbi:AAA family ATPase [Streptomyces sp. GTA36]
MEDVLRGPTPPPGVPVPFVGRDLEVDALAARLNRWSEPGTSDENPKAVVLHGPAGVGKSALAAALVERLGLRHAHWLSLGDRARAEPTLLRLLAEHRAPRRPVVEAALTADRTGDEREFARELRDQCQEHIQGSVLVLDGVHPTLGAELLEVLHQGTNLVIITSRQKARWADLGVYLHRVRPLSARDSVQLAQGVAAARWAGFSPNPEHRRLVSAARGLPLWSRVAGAVLAGLEGTTPVPVKGPGELLTLAADLLDPAVADMLLRLAAQEEGSAPFTALTVEALLPEDAADPSDVPHILSSLRSYELLLEPRDGHLVLPSPVAAAALLRMPQTDGALLTARVQAAVEKAATHSALGVARLLDGREVPGGHWETRFTPGELAEHVDEFMGLLDRHRYLLGNRHDLADALATLLAVRGDAHRLVALHRASGDLTRRRLSLLYRALGTPQTFRSGQVEETPQQAVLGQADALYRSGELDRTLEKLDSAPETHAADSAWLSMIRGATLCDQGRPLAAETELEEAAETYRLTSCVRGRGWALLHHARASLLMSHVSKADHLLGQATQALRTSGDIRGLNWAATERIRLLLLRGEAEAALIAAQRALTAHEQAEDVRGMGWTCHLLGLGHARLGHTADARVALLASADHFRTCDDQLGAAWTRHRLALLTPDQWQVPELRSTAAEFTELGCDLGQAWSLLECALRTRPSRDEPDRALAKTLFTTLDDQGGLAWAQAVRARRLLPDKVTTLADLTRNLSQVIHGRERLVEDIRTFWRTTSEGSRPAIPFYARDTVAVSDPRGHKPLAKYLTTGTPSPTAPRCRTRLTLLDDSPATHATARILLRVTPEAGHPWASSHDDRPWLTVVALPLTPASVEPPTALLRASPHEVHGAEFALTAHRSGIHVIRFTIALERTGTVLQQVETELEILDTDHPADLAAPHATSLRGR